MSEVLNVVESVEAPDGSVVEVVEYEGLSGSSDVRTAGVLYHLTQARMRLRMVRIKLKGGHVRVEPGALYFMKGRLEMKATTGGGVMKGLARKMLSGETFFINEIHGEGEIWLEPTFGHFLLQRVSTARPIIADKGLFYAGTSRLEVGAVRQKYASAALFGGEGMFQTRVAGDGVAVLYSPVPRQEVQCHELHNSKLWVDGNFALMRSESVEFRTEKSSKGLVSSSVSGEGLLQTYTGTGRVWIAPTQAVYAKLATPQGQWELAAPPASRHTDVTQKK